MIRVLVNGAKGRMGSHAVAAVTSHPELELVGATDSDADLAQAIADTSAQVVVDFTVASVGMANALAILNANARPVIGTSGFQEPQVRELQALAHTKKLGGVIAPNFALGAVLMMRFAKEAAQFLPDVEIIELHHDRKEESPSGTALRTAELIAAGRAQSGAMAAPSRGSELIAGARGGMIHNTPVHSVRLPGLIAHQEVVFGGLGEGLTIRHDSYSRESFMPGVCIACQRVMEKSELVYGLEHLLFGQYAGVA